MIFGVSNTNAERTYHWDIKDSRTSATIFCGEGDHVSLNFTGVNVYYSVVLTERAKGVIYRVARSDSVVSKYVRREIRTLTEPDRARYFDAMGVVYRLSLKEGVERYGTDFINHGHLTALHDSTLYAFHENLVFQNAHPMFQLKVERAVLAIDPGAGLPYWDFTIDHDLGADWDTSIIYREDWFGTVDNEAADDFRIRGNFRNVTTLMDTNATAFPNAYHTLQGFLGPDRNVNGAHYIQRTNQFCGFKAIESPASCGHMMSCFDNYTTLYDWDRCLEDTLHGNIHNIHTGMWRCPVSWEAFLDEHSDWLDPHLLSLLAVHAPFMIQSVSDELLTCPNHCGKQRRGFKACRCTPTAASNIHSIRDIDSLECETVYDWIADQYSKTYEYGYLGKHFIELKDGEYFFRGLTSEQTCAVNRLVLKTIIYPGEFGVMGGGGSPNDPLFFVIHQIFEKMTQVLRLSPRYRELNTTWDNTALGNLTGFGWNSKTPFTARLFGLEEEAEEETYLTNKQIWELLKPDSDTVPYIYDQFQDWGSCSVDFSSTDGVRVDS